MIDLERILEAIRKRGVLRNGLIAVASALAASIFFYYLLESYVIRQAEKNIENLLISHKGIHHYVQKTMLPALYAYKQRGELPEAFYAPELFSSSFIVRNQHQFYNEELEQAGYPPLYYKLAAKNPRNPINKADALESRLISKFNQNRSLKKHREILEKDGESFLYIAIPFLANESRCILCHGKREQAPLELQKIYPGQGGFNEKIGEIRAITSIKAPLKQEYHPVQIAVASLSIGIFSLVFLTFFNSQLRRRIHESTRFLEKEVIEKNAVTQKLVERENYLKTIQNAMRVGLILMNRRTEIIIDINPFALELVGLSKEEVIGQPASTFLKSGDVEDLPNPQKSRIGEESEGTLMTHNGQSITVLKTDTEFALNNEVVVLESFFDLTKQKEAEQEKAQLEARLNQAQKMEALGTLAGGIAHDFNNILSIIIGYAELLQEDGLSQEAKLNNMNQILTAGYRAKDLVNQILTFSRQSKIQKEQLDPISIVKEALPMLRASIPSTIQIEDQIDANCHFIEADPTRFHQVLLNLCTNAFQAMDPGGGKLLVVLRNEKNAPENNRRRVEIERDDLVYLGVTDTGAGMPPDLISKIFDPFFTTKESGKGTGLGLSTTFGIIHEYGGVIKVDSRLGEGTTFHIYLPACIVEPNLKTEPSETVPTGNEHILYVDDEELLTNMINNMLRRLGYRVTTTNRGAKALKMIQNKPEAFDLVITDQTMPGMTGSELARKLKEIRPDLPILLCTGYSTTIDELSAKVQGISGYLLKPMRRTQLAQMIRSILDTNHHRN